MELTQTGVARKTGKKPFLFIGILFLALCVSYGVCCGLAAASTSFFPHTRLNEQAVSGMSVEQAVQALSQAILDGGCTLRTADGSGASARVDYRGLVSDPPCAEAEVQAVYLAQHGGGVLTGGGRYLFSLFSSHGYSVSVNWDEEKLETKAEELSQQLSRAPVDSSYTLGDNSITIQKAQDGCSVSAKTLRDLIEAQPTAGGDEVTVDCDTASAKTLTAQEIYDEVSAEVKNAGYDAATGTITAEQIGAEFDADEAQRLLDAAADGTQVDVPAQIEHPSVTAEQLKAVLFRDVLGTCTTHVGGTSARISNVKLASSVVNGTVLNSGDVFSYNDTVGQRTQAKGYQPAPAYVQGETVDEIGGGVCQPSSTLYLACLRSNLEIVERAAHRYVPAYITKGMDATVSWGGPDYKFKNDTEYPIKISAVYSKGYLTMTLYGTKTDQTTVKMTFEQLSTTPWETIYQDDATLAAGTQQVKVTPYTGYKVRTYRNLYDGDGNLISSKLEATSDYKVRNKIVLVGPALPDSGASSSSGSSSSAGAETPGTDTTDPGTGTDAPGTGTTDPETDAETGTGTTDTETTPPSEEVPAL